MYRKNYNELFSEDLSGTKIGVLNLLYREGSKYFCQCVCGEKEWILNNSLRKNRRFACHKCQPRNFNNTSQRNCFIRNNFPTWNGQKEKVW